MVQGTGLHVLVERAISLNRPLRTRTVGGVGAGGEKPLATRLGIVIGCIASPIYREGLLLLWRQHYFEA